MGWWDDVLGWKAKQGGQPTEQIMKILEMSTREIEEDLMAKKVLVTFKKTDGLEPRRSEDDGKPFALKLPMTITVPTGHQKVGLGLTCNLPCIVVRYGKAELFAPGQDLKVTLETAETTTYGQGETVAKCYPIDCSNMEIEGG